MARRLQADFIIKDPIYGYFELTDLERGVIETTVFQRLRFITQNGLAFFTYPSLRGSRFEHSIGAAHLAGRVIESILLNTAPQVLAKMFSKLGKELSELVPERDRPALLEYLKLKNFTEIPAPPTPALEAFLCQFVRMLALLHDIGHLPFSHLGEEALEDFAPEIFGPTDWREYSALNPRPKLHEYISFKLILTQPSELDRAFAHHHPLLTVIRVFYTARLNSSVPPGIAALYEIISSDVDVDRGDYLRRDGYNSGIGFGHYDIERLVGSVAITEIQRDDGTRDFIVAPSDATISTVETFLVERYKLHKWLYFHHSIQYFNYCLAQALRFLVDLQKRLALLPAEKFKLEYFHYTRYVYRDGFICNEIWLWDVFYKALIELQGAATRADLREDVLRDVHQALTYLEVIVRRAKMGFTIWKTHPEYLQLNRRLQQQVLETPPESDSATRPRYLVGELDLAAAEERSFLNAILGELRAQPERLRDFLRRFHKTGIPIRYSDVKSVHAVEGMKDEDVIGKVFLTICEFEPFDLSKQAGTLTEPLSRFEFRVRRPNGGNRIRLTEVSQLVAGLRDAWRSDVQCFLYFHVARPGLDELVNEMAEGGCREQVANVARERFTQRFVAWLKEAGLLRIVT